MPAISIRAVLGVLGVWCSLVFGSVAGLRAQQDPRQVQLSGAIHDVAGRPIGGATVRAGGRQTLSDASGGYTLTLSKGQASVEVAFHGQTLQMTVDLEQDRTLDMVLAAADSITVRADRDAMIPDPAAQGYARSELIDANPGRPGVPVSIPGYPAETASGGIKAPQYFAPGVAGDHGEPIAQFFQLGGFLIQNNLTANAHGNGYADPNMVIASTLGGVLVDNAGYNVRYGDHSINLAVTYDIRDRLASFLEVTSDGRDGAVSAGWSPATKSGHSEDTRGKEWVAVEALFGDGFLRLPEQRRQYKLNAFRQWQIGRHTVDAYGIGYYGESRIPGLIPLFTPVSEDTIDPRQKDQTHTTMEAVADRWQISAAGVLSTGAFFRTYNLALRSNFGDGLIQQSEFRTVAGGDATYSQSLGRKWLLLAGLDARRDAPRGLNLARADLQGVLSLVTSNNLTITGLAPFLAVSGRPLPWMQVYGGVRRDELDFENDDLLTPSNSFHSWPGTTSPKVNLTFGRPDSAVLPQVSFSFGKAFHANDPRIGTGNGRGDLIIQAREFQMFALKEIAGTELRLTIAHVTNSAELAKIDPDTGLQQDVGPSINRFLTLAARRRFNHGFLQATWSAADARDRLVGSPVPEGPRMIIDGVARIERLPLGLEGEAEYEYVKAKPLGDGFTGVPLQEVRLALKRRFDDGRWSIAANAQLADGYSGQTLETLAVGEEPASFERRVGVPERSYGSLSLNYFFGR